MEPQPASASSTDGRMKRYILVGEVVIETTLDQWIRWYQRNSRDIAQTVLKAPGGDVRVSTIFLGLNYNFASRGPPIVFETMVFGGVLGEQVLRYATLHEARRGHARMVRRAREWMRRTRNAS